MRYGPSSSVPQLSASLIHPSQSTSLPSTNTGSYSDPIIVDSEHEDRLPSTPTIQPRRWHHRRPREKPYMKYREDLAISITLASFRREDIAGDSKAILLRDLPVGVTSHQLSQLLAEHRLSRIVESVSLYQADRIAVLRFIQMESLKFARQVLETIPCPFPQRPGNTLLMVEELQFDFDVNSHHDVESSISSRVQGPSTTDQGPLASPESNPYGALDQLYENLDVGTSSDAESLVSQDSTTPQSLPAPVSNPDTNLVRRRPVASYLLSDPDSSDSDAENVPSTSSRPFKRSHRLGHGGTQRNRDKRVRVPSEGATMVQSQPMESSLSRGTLRVPKVQHGRARRVLIPTSTGLPMVTVSMRADFQFFDIQRRIRLASKSMPASLLEDTLHVEDAVIVGDTVIVGYDKGPFQVTSLKLGSGSKVDVKRSELTHRPHATDPASKINVSCRGVSCLAPDLSGSSFFSGGYDRTVHRWPMDGGGVQKITTVNAAPSALACRQKQLLIGVGKTMEIYDLGHIHASPQRFKFSNVICHVHMHPSAGSISLVEVEHLDQQVLLFDCRTKQYDRAADCVLGHRSDKWSRYYRGSVLHSYFVRGYSDDTICLWDFRNPKAPVARKRHGVKAVHTAFTDAGIVAFGGETVTFLDFNLNVV
ncbi:hypothetical protein V5O48_000031 [Marasmius crinis-equi]|uniref:Uncharacterized protein n=1 Tax=Marasmius crinis-equi TaxID=585013 RepID=A0ABR3G298_9AGAR